MKWTTEDVAAEIAELWSLDTDRQKDSTAYINDSETAVIDAGAEGSFLITVERVL